MRHFEKQPRHSIRKLSVGVCSTVIAMALFASGGQVYADDLGVNSNPETVSKEVLNSEQEIDGEKEVSPAPDAVGSTNDAPLPEEKDLEKTSQDVGGNEVAPPVEGEKEESPAPPVVTEETPQPRSSEKTDHGVVSEIGSDRLRISGDESVYQNGYGLDKLIDGDTTSDHSLAELKWDWEGNHVNGKLPENVSLPQTIELSLTDTEADTQLNKVEIYKRINGNGTLTK